MYEPRKVTGQECLQYVDRFLGFADHMQNNDIYFDGNNGYIGQPNCVYLTGHRTNGGDRYVSCSVSLQTNLLHVAHDTSKRIVGYVTNRYEDGGLTIKILGNEKLNFSGTNNGGRISTVASFYAGVPYTQDIFSTPVYYNRDDVVNYPTYNEGTHTDQAYSGCRLTDVVNYTMYNYMDMLDFMPSFTYNINLLNGLEKNYKYGGANIGNTRQFNLSNNEDNTLEYGALRTIGQLIRIQKEYINDPLSMLAGDLYSWAKSCNQEFTTLAPGGMADLDFPDYKAFGGTFVESSNRCSLIYNLILTEDLSAAKEYLANGTVPYDAWLYPLDFENLPTYDPDETGEDPDHDDESTPDDMLDDIDPNLPEPPSNTSQSLSNNNYYWLTVAELEGFVNWFWNDVGEITDFESLFAKIEGLYNDLASSVLMIRYMPVNIEWIGGAGTPSNIITGMIEKKGPYSTIAHNRPPIREIGSVHVPKKYKSFLDYSPYTNVTLYLPFHGHLELDTNLVMGHDIYVKCVYDFLSGTVLYMIYRDNQMLLNTVMAKMCVDIPITLQSKSDRDNAIFNNVSNSVAGLLGSATTLATGNPIGLVAGMGALTTGVQSAPMTIRSNMGENEAFYAPHRCCLYIKRPIHSKPSHYGRSCGYVSDKYLKLSNLNGYTKCFNPHIKFKASDDILEEEIEEIYNYLEEGVIL